MIKWLVGIRGGGKHIFCAELSFFFCVCLYDVPWVSFYVHIIAEKSFLIYFVLAICIRVVDKASNGIWEEKIFNDSRKVVEKW